MKKVNNFIQRKSLIYITGIKYGNYTINHIQGCSHGSKYSCYAFLLKKHFDKKRKQRIAKELSDFMSDSSFC
jgi:DNA repair photolyase